MVATAILIYFVLGLVWIAHRIIKEGSWNLDTGFASNKVVYPLGICLWWFWAYLEYRR